jgi:Subunit ChlI of Mg-chelatase
MVARHELETEALVVLESQLLAPASECLLLCRSHTTTVMPVLPPACEGMPQICVTKVADTREGDDRRGTAPSVGVISRVLVCAHAFAVDRGTVGHVEVEVDLRAGLPALSLIGIPSGSARGVRERVQAAILNSGFGFPRRRVTVNVAPATRSTGAELDLAVACCILGATGEFDPNRLKQVGFCAELSLGGELRSSSGAPGAAQRAARASLGGLIVARSDLRAATLADGALVVGRRTLREVITLLAQSPREVERAFASARLERPVNTSAPRRGRSAAQ